MRFDHINFILYWIMAVPYRVENDHYILVRLNTGLLLIINMVILGTLGDKFATLQISGVGT